MRSLALLLCAPLVDLEAAFTDEAEDPLRILFCLLSYSPHLGKGICCAVMMLTSSVSVAFLRELVAESNASTIVAGS